MVPAEMLGPLGIILILLIGFGLPIALGVGFSVLLLRATQKRSRVFGLSAAFWAAMIVAGDFASPFQVTTGFGWVDPASVGYFLAEAAVAGLIGGLAGLAALWLTRAMFFITQEQDGQWCWRCSYRTGSERITICPECGATVDALRFRWNWLYQALSWGRRLGWPGTAALLMLAVLWVSVNWSSRIRPEMDFTRAMRGAGSIEPAAYFAPGATQTSFGQPCQGARLPLNPPSALDLLVAYTPQAANGTQMQLQVSKVLRKSEHSMESTLGVPRILCDLNEQQARDVLEHGVPQSLKDAMVKAASGVRWNGWVGTAPVPPDVRVDPAPHFPGP